MGLDLDFWRSLGGLRTMIWLSEQVTLNGEEHVLVGSLDLNQGLRVLPGEPAGIKSEMGSSFVARTASLSLTTPSRSVQVILCSS